MVQDRTHPFLSATPKKMLIGGDWCDSEGGRTFVSVDPSTGQPLAHIAEGTAADIDRAVRVARATFTGSWRKTKPFDRQKTLLKFAELVDEHYDELARLDTLDYGGPISRTSGKRNRHVGLIRYYAGLATAIHGDTIENSLPGRVQSYTIREPVGVVGGIFAWNVPMDMMIWKTVPAIATGCCIVVKPPTEAALTALRLGELLLEAGVPAGVVNIVPGGAEAGTALVEHPDVDKISFTGSTSTGQKIIRSSAGNLKRLSLELGGKSPNIVFADADLDLAISGAAMAVFPNCGQMCHAGSRLFVQRSIYEDFLERLVAFTERTIAVGDPLDPRTDIGPLVSERQLERVLGYMRQGEADGARTVYGGKRISAGALLRGNFVEPTVFAGVRNDMTIAREEIFGPVICAIPFNDVEDVIEMANDTPYGLASGVWTSNLTTANVVMSNLRAGTVWINCYGQLDPAIPFGGYKMSGIGRESGLQHFDSFLETKSVIARYD